MRQLYAVGSTTRGHHARRGKAQTARTIVFGDAMAPIPVSPHANVFSTGSITCTFGNSDSTARCFPVNGEFHIAVFMAGATKTAF